MPVRTGGLPGTLSAILTTTGNIDIGAYQHSDGATGSIRTKGFPGLFSGIITGTGFRDIGAFQHLASTGSGGGTGGAMLLGFYWGVPI